MARPRKGNPTIGEFCEKHLVDRPNKTITLDNLVNAGKRRGLSDNPASYQRAMARLMNDDMPEGMPSNSYFEIIAAGRKWQFVAPVGEPTDWLPEASEQPRGRPVESEESEEDASRPINPNEEVILRWYLMDLATVAIIDGRQCYQNLLNIAKEVHRDKRNDPGSAARWVKMTNDERLLYMQEMMEELRKQFDRYNTNSYDKMLGFKGRRK